MKFHKKTPDSSPDFWFILGAIMLFGLSAFAPSLVSFIGFSVLNESVNISISNNSENTTSDNILIDESPINITLPENITVANITNTTTNLTDNTNNITINATENTTTPDLSLNLFIGLMYPANGSEQESNITFNYDLDSIDNIEQCSIYLIYRYIDTEFTIKSTDNTPVIAENTFTLTNLIDGEYLWKIGCENQDDKIFSNTWTIFVGDSDLSYRNTSPLNITTNLSDIIINTSNITGLPSDSLQGSARLGEPVNWTRRIVLNHTGPVIVRTYLPESAKNIKVFETTLENIPDKGLTLSETADRI